mmetsp:Transcript_15731/g.49239  ORF Transcript_15731/g.49239 Transcript_15731/m.49239 type:complete len:577 (-) Transcript_15731:532-2262(-)
MFSLSSPSKLGKRKAPESPEAHLADNDETPTTPTSTPSPSPQLPSVELLFTILSNDFYPLSSLLRDSDLFMVSQTCKSAKERVGRTVVTKENAVQIALGGPGEAQHNAMLRWSAGVALRFSDAFWVGLDKLGDADLIEQCWGLVKDDDNRKLCLVLKGAAQRGHGRVALDRINRAVEKGVEIAQFTKVWDFDALRIAAAQGGSVVLARRLGMLAQVPLQRMELPDPDLQGTWAGLRQRQSRRTRTPPRRNMDPFDSDHEDCHHDEDPVEEDLQDHRLSCFRELLVRHAIRAGHTLLSQLLLQHLRESFDGGKKFRLAVHSGSVELAEFVLARGWRGTTQVIRHAIKSGSVAMVRWVVSRGASFDELDVVAAMEAGNIPMVDWLVKQGLPLSPNMLYAAVQARHTTSLVLWMLRHECPYDPYELAHVVWTGVRDCAVLRALLNPPGEVRVQLDLAGCVGDPSPVVDASILHQKFGLPLPENYLLDAVRRRDIRRLRYALAHGQLFTAEAAKLTFRYDQCAILVEVLMHGTVDGKLKESIRTAIEEGISAGREEYSCVPVRSLSMFYVHVARKPDSIG